MILGKPLTVGGAKGLTPIIYVNSITGSTVTCDGVEGTEVSGTWTFKTTIGTHTIVGQYNGKTQTKTVVVDSVGVYEVTLDYKLWLLNVVDGQLDECEDVTGGWEYKYENTLSRDTLVKNSDNLQIGTPSYRTDCKTVNLINVSNYTKLYVDMEVYSVSNTGGRFVIYNDDSLWEVIIPDRTTAMSRTTVNASFDISASGYVIFNIYRAYMKVYKVWLE